MGGEQMRADNLLEQVNELEGERDRLRVALDYIAYKPLALGEPEATHKACFDDVVSIAKNALRGERAGREIRIVFKPNVITPNLLFTEIEDEHGCSIVEPGEWRDREDGFRELVLRVV